MRWFLVLLSFLPARAENRRDCGIVSGERYWITSEGLLFPDGTVMPDWIGCQLTQDVTLILAYDESDRPLSCAFREGESGRLLGGGFVEHPSGAICSLSEAKWEAGSSIRVGYEPPTPNYVIEVHRACKPAKDEEAQVRDLVSKVRKALSERIRYADEVPVVEKPCADRRRVDARIVP